MVLTFLSFILFAFSGLNHDATRRHECQTSQGELHGLISVIVFLDRGDCTRSRMLVTAGFYDTVLLFCRSHFVNLLVPTHTHMLVA